MSRSNPRGKDADTNTSKCLESCMEPIYWSRDYREDAGNWKDGYKTRAEKGKVKSRGPKNIVEMCTGNSGIAANASIAAAFAAY